MAWQEDRELMTRLRLYQVDAFASEVFGGNPAAVCPLDDWLPDHTLQAIAEENNLSETAFFVTSEGAHHLRWFTPRHEVPLCGHATLAAAFVFFNFIRSSARAVTFRTASGNLRVRRSGDRLTMDLPALVASPCDAVPPALVDGLGRIPETVLRTDADPNFIVVLDREDHVAALEPRLDVWERLHPFGVVVTAQGSPSRSGGTDFVSRYFAPSYGIPEDPVTGSVHCALMPYWAARFARTRLRARQLSRRGGTLDCELKDTRVVLSGTAVLYLQGAIYV